MTNPIVSICIPTYNRAQHLANALESIYQQLKHEPQLAQQVEISISDNASSDATRTVAEMYRLKFPNFTYARNDKNLGADLNYLQVVRNASGEYVWFLGDDDTILPGAIAYVVALVSVHPYDVGGVESVADTKTDIQNQSPYTTDNTFITNNPNTYFHKGYCRGLLSSVIIRRDKMLQQITEDDFMEYWLYYEAALKVLGLGESSYFFVTKPMVSTGQDCRWVENGGELTAFVNSNILHHKMLRWGFDQEALTTMLNTNIKSFPIMLFRAKGHDLPCTFKNFSLILKHSKPLNPLLRGALLIIFLIPNSIIKCARDVRKKYTSHD